MFGSLKRLIIQIIETSLRKKKTVSKYMRYTKRSIVTDAKGIFEISLEILKKILN